MVLQRIADDGFLNEDDLRAVVHEAAQSMDVEGKRVLFIIPDYTRSMPMPTMFSALFDALQGRVAKMDYLVALGTHPPMTDEQIHTLLGISPQERAEKYGDVGIFNHEWQNPDMLSSVGTLNEDAVEEISNGLLRESVDVTVNKRIFDYDLVCIVGPVFPHEVVGFSGGNKYFFPGIGGQEILDFFHWLGALITNYKINGTKHTPVRAVVDKAASLINLEKRCFCLTVLGHDTKAIFFGSPEDAWSKAADMAAQTHIIYKDKPFKSVLAMVPPMYDEVWTAGKGMYKLEPVVADGGELIIYGAHVRDISITHGKYIKKAGYHVRDYFSSRMEEFQDIPRGILAHCTHVRGMGSYENGVEKTRVQVTLATSVPEEECRAVNLGYRDMNSINPDDWKDREDEGYLLVPKAGEVLYHLKK
jgi:lactate racemase